MKTIHDASFIFFSQVIIFLEINKPFSISINIEWFIVFIQYCHIEILLSINQAINIDVYKRQQRWLRIPVALCRTDSG